MAENDDNSDEEFEEAFGPLRSCEFYEIFEIKQVRDNDSDFGDLSLRLNDDNDEPPSPQLSPKAWKLLGRYVARNDYMRRVAVCGDHDMVNTPLLFKHWTNSRSLEDLNLSDNRLDANAIRSMVPLLTNTRSTLTSLNLTSPSIDTECFETITSTLDGGSIEKLFLGRCGISDISSLDRCNLPQLRALDFMHNNITRSLPSLEQFTSLEELGLRGTNIGMDGCRLIANLLRSERTSLRELSLAANNVCDEGAQIIAESLKRNTTLKKLWLQGNKFGEEGEGEKAFLTLVNDVSSIERTCRSNHTLEVLTLSRVHWEFSRVQKHIASALKINEKCKVDHWGKPGGNPGREKVLETQLDSKTRMAICSIQGVDVSYGSLFADIDPILLPNIFAIVGRYKTVQPNILLQWCPKHRENKSELYRMLVETAPDFTSLINKRSMLEDTIAKEEAHLASLSAAVAMRLASIDSLKRRLVSIKSGSADLEERAQKRQRNSGDDELQH